MAEPLSTTRTERLALCDLLGEVGPDAPTLCEGWQAADLAAHLYVREHNPVAGMGIMLSPLAGYTERATRRTRERTDYDDLIERIRSGPPLPFRWVDDQMNLTEFFVHHEDVRRGDRRTGPRPEGETAELDADLWKALGRGGKFMTRALKGTGLELEWPDHGTRRIRDGETTARLVGRPGELVLYLFGRKDVARVELQGDDEAVARVRATPLGV